MTKIKKQEEFYTLDIEYTITVYKHKNEDDFPGKIINGNNTKTGILFKEQIASQSEMLIRDFRKDIERYTEHYKLEEKYEPKK